MVVIVEPFAQRLTRLLKAAAMAKVDFAKRVGISAPLATQITNGYRSPPVDKLDAMADALGLKGRERKLFIRLGLVEQLPEPSRPEFRQLLQELEELRRLLDDTGHRRAT